jgi:hypothetical protein
MWAKSTLILPGIDPENTVSRIAGKQNLKHTRFVRCLSPFYSMINIL